MDRERGAVTLYVVIAVAAVFLVVGLVVDGGGRLHALEKANSIAREAARVAGQEVDLSTLNSGIAASPAEAQAEGEKYLKAMGCASGHVTVSPDRIAATCDLPYTSLFLSGSYVAHGEGHASPTKVVT